MAEPATFLRTAAGPLPVIVLSGPVDHGLAADAEALLRPILFDRDGSVAIDISAVEGVSGALLGLLLRANRRLAWRNRRLYVVCTDASTRHSLEVAGLDELATLTAVVPS